VIPTALATAPRSGNDLAIGAFDGLRAVSPQTMLARCRRMNALMTPAAISFEACHADFCAQRSVTAAIECAQKKCRNPQRPAC
jgi:hypothetical protein